MKNVMSFFLGVIIMIVILIGGRYYKLAHNKPQIVMNTLHENYYNLQNINKAIETKLGDQYSQDKNKNYEKYIMKLIMEDINKYESDEMVIYNKYYTKEELKTLFSKLSNDTDVFEGRYLNNDSYYIKFTSFEKGKTFKEFEEHISDIGDSRNLVLDIRDNSGGSVDEFKKIMSLFIDEGQHMFSLVSDTNEEKVYSQNRKIISVENIILLTNGKTASVSELMILGLSKYHNNVTIIGTRTRGKYFSFGLKKYLDGSGVTFVKNIMEGPDKSIIPKNGIEPTIYIGHSEEYYKSLSEVEDQKTREKDNRLQLEEVYRLLN
ncbi:S41 family peptidase [Alkaliphilus hydrothermalis]|uniref:Tail specific protease domain-containing protein n=1 Tax=Alkaliphilus hydrothermalis TaxID=1482730 RepID=A0ABS2NQ16_9FIRM|nr:S41 family peptidase [Alkaliphilus hydrothermalis]MBM7615045.1 hypothetical protein [Alkaliphilus hydrothermalis]